MGKITEKEKVDDLENLEIIRKFKNSVFVDANVITSQISTPEDIVAEFKLKQMKKEMKATMI